MIEWKFEVNKQSVNDLADRQKVNDFYSTEQTTHDLELSFDLRKKKKTDYWEKIFLTMINIRKIMRHVKPKSVGLSIHGRC